MKGTVKWYNEVKGFGFIRSENGSDVFVHRSGLVSEFSGLQTDESVSFELKQTQKGMVAVNVEPA